MLCSCEIKNQKTMIQPSNPFNDPRVREEILSSEGLLQEDNAQYEEISGDIRSIVSSAPKIPKSAKNIILDANAIAKNQKDQKAMQISCALNQVFSEYNRKYNTDLQINLDNLSETLVNVANPEKRKLLELYVSETMKSMKPILLLHILNRLTLAIDWLLQPERLLDQNSFSNADLFLVVEKLISFTAQIDDLVKEASIKDSDLVLKRLAEEREDDSLSSDESKKVVDDFMKMFRKENGID